MVIYNYKINDQPLHEWVTASLRLIVMSLHTYYAQNYAGLIWAPNPFFLALNATNY